MVYRSVREFLTKYNQNSNKKKKKVKAASAVVATVISASILAGGILSLKNNENLSVTNLSDTNYTKISYTTETNIKEVTKEKAMNVNGTYLKNWNGIEYKFCSQEYVNSLAKQSLSDAKEMLLNVNGITPVGTKNGSFYPDYFNEDMLSAIAFTESSFRTSQSNGEPLTSPTGAIGMCQLEPIAINTINSWLKNTMGINKEYTIEDANDPQKSLEMCVLLNIRNCKNIAKEGKEIYNQIGSEFSLELQEKLLYAIYFYGEGNVKNAASGGILLETYLNPNWKDANGNNYVYKVLENKEMLSQNNFNK